MDSLVQYGVALAVIYVGYKLIFGGPSQPAAPRQPRQVPQEQIDAVLNAFPQVTENQARWDLGRSGSLQVTMERLIRDGRLPDPPPGLFPASSSQPSTTSSGSATSKSFTQPNLITRFGLQNRIEESEDIKGKGKEQEREPNWAATSNDRQDSLRERKARMILDARKQMIERDRLAAQ